MAKMTVRGVQRMPDARLVVFEESSHCPVLEEPDLFNKTVLEFVESLAGSET